MLRRKLHALAAANKVLNTECIIPIATLLGIQVDSDNVIGGIDPLC